VHFPLIDALGRHEDGFRALEFEPEVAGVVDFVEDGGHAGAVLDAVHEVGEGAGVDVFHRKGISIYYNPPPPSDVRTLLLRCSGEIPYDYSLL
jgi:hypothetical protein